MRRLFVSTPRRRSRQIKTNVRSPLRLRSRYPSFCSLANKSERECGKYRYYSGLLPECVAGMYGASCAAVHQWSDVLRIELEPFGVTVILVCPLSPHLPPFSFPSPLTKPKVRP
jgi:short-subunit dehydrogenase involved in D-alanine esterification of teichoic acids